MRTRPRAPGRPAKVGGGGPLLSYLRAVDIFRDLSTEEINAIHDVTPMRRRSKGTVFYRPGDRAERLFILKEGSVTLYRLTPEGHKLIVATVGAGTIFGEMALAGQSMWDCFAEAEDDALVCTITRRDMERLLQEQPRVALRLLAIMGRRVQELEERLEQMAYRTVRERLGRLLLGNSRRSQGGYEVKGFTHEYLAEAVGASRQTVTQELRRMENAGLLEIGRKRLRLLDVPGLQGIVSQPRWVLAPADPRPPQGT